MREHAGERIVEARGLGRRFGRHWAVARLDLDLAQGESLLLAGPNGSGKTTLLRLLAGLYRPTTGRVRLFGLDPMRDRQTCRRKLSMLSHASYLYPRLTALEMVRIWARMLGKAEGREALEPVLREVGLEAWADTVVAGFSAGMRKRLAFARTRLERPRLLLLDEPFSALDAAGRRLVESWVARFRSEGGSVVIASHDVDRSRRLCDRGLVLGSGQRVWSGPAEETQERMEALL